MFGFTSTLKVEATCSSETSVGFQGTTRRYIPGDKTLNNHGCENLKSNISMFSSATSLKREGERERRKKVER
jgi:hypothetical protein